MNHQYAKSRSSYFLIGLMLMGMSATAQLQKVRVNGAEITYQQQGQGEVVLFVHGTQEDLRVFMPQLELLSDDYRVVTYSRRFNYPNDYVYKEDYSFSAESEAHDLASFIKALQLEPVHLVGHSFGGLIAMLLAEKHPQLIASLILSEPAAISWLPDIASCSTWFDSVQINLLEAVATSFESGDTTEIMQALFMFFAGRDLQSQLPPEVLRALKVNLTEVKALVSSEEPFTHVNRRILSDFDKPVLLLSAGNTLPMIACINEELRAVFPSAQFHHLSEASHDYWMTHPQVLSQHLRAFIRP